MLSCLARITLEFDGNPEFLEMEDLLKYDGEKDLSAVTSFEAVADTREMTLSVLGTFFPRLQKLRLNNSVIASVRDISSSLPQLRYLWLAHCGLESLDGISTISDQLEELYLAFNRITDLNDLIGMANLRVLDLEDNQITNLDECAILQCCSSLKALALAGNPGSQIPDYREHVHALLPQLIYLDEKRIKPKQEEPKVRIAPLDLPFEALEKIEKGEKCGVKPRSSEEFSRDVAVSEFVLDVADERPPTSRGIFEPSRDDVMGSWAKPKQRLVTRAIVTPKLTRPGSSCLLTRVGKH
jgi:hypothetical protein